MYELHINNNKLFEKKDFDEIIPFFNKILSIYDDAKIPLDVAIENNKITVNTIDNTIVLKNEIINFGRNELYLFPFFIFNRKLISELTSNKLKGIIELNPNYILDIMSFNKCMIDPYLILIKLFNVNEELFYQVFIQYLNKTIKVNKVKNQINTHAIINKFFYDSSNVINMNRYHKLFLFYLSNKGLLPFMISYTPYISGLLI